MASGPFPKNIHVPTHPANTTRKTQKKKIRQLSKRKNKIKKNISYRKTYPGKKKKMRPGRLCGTSLHHTEQTKKQKKHIYSQHNKKYKTT